MAIVHEFFYRKKLSVGFVMISPVIVMVGLLGLEFFLNLELTGYGNFKVQFLYL